MDAYSCSALESKIHRLKPERVFQVVPEIVFSKVAGKPEWRHVNNGSYYEWRFAISAALQPESVLEVGVFYGYSLACFALGSKRIKYVEGWDSCVYDPESNIVCADVLKSAGIKCEIELKRVDALHAEPIRRDFDLVHVDGPHTFDGTLRILEEFENVPFLLVDDTSDCADNRDAMRRFCSESGRRKIDIPTTTGATLICPGES